MLKKYLPIIALLAAALFLYWIKTKQRGETKRPSVNTEIQATDLPFKREAAALVFSKHAKCRMDCRHIDEGEIKEILAKGTVNTSKIISGPKGVSYPLEGNTSDGQHVRVVFAPKTDGKLVVVTVIDLETEFACDCP
jgi:hypothetical protein